MSEDEKAAMKKRVSDAATALAEHFDSVQVFVTVHSGGSENTMSYECGVGNFYARLGQINEWLAMQDQFQRNEAIKRDQE